MSNPRPPSSVVIAAVAAASASPCRSQRGAVIFRPDGSIVATGYNDQPAPTRCDGSAACKETCRITCVHAEERALINAGFAARGSDMLHIKAVDGAGVATGPPSCVECSKLSLAAGIVRFWLLESSGWVVYDIVDFHLRSLAAAVPSHRVALLPE